MPKKTSKSQRKSRGKSGKALQTAGDGRLASSEHPAQSDANPGGLLPAFEFGLLCAELRWFRTQALAARDLEFWREASDRLHRMRTKGQSAFLADTTGSVARLLDNLADAECSITDVKFQSADQYEYWDSIVNGRHVAEIDDACEELENFVGDPVGEIHAALRTALGVDHEQVRLVELGLRLGEARYPKRVVSQILELVCEEVIPPRRMNQARTKEAAENSLRLGHRFHLRERGPTNPSEGWESSFRAQWCICFPDVPPPDVTGTIEGDTQAFDQIVRDITRRLDLVDEQRVPWPPDDGWHIRPNQFAVLGKRHPVSGRIFTCLELLISHSGSVSQREICDALWPPLSTEKQSSGWQPRESHDTRNLKSDANRDLRKMIGLGGSIEVISLEGKGETGRWFLIPVEDLRKLVKDT